MRFDGITHYIKAAPRRLADARELLQHPTYEKGARDAGHRHLRGAAYLAGYAVECALKAYIISRIPGCQTFSQARERLPVDMSGARSHDFRLLAQATDLESDLLSRPELAGHWVWCRKWQPDLRYDGTHMTSKGDARRMVDAAEVIWRWVEARRKTEPGRLT